MHEGHNSYFRLACWRIPAGVYLQLPEAVQGYPFGPLRRSYLLYPYYHPPVAQPLLTELNRDLIQVPLIEAAFRARLL